MENLDRIFSSRRKVVKEMSEEQKATATKAVNIIAEQLDSKHNRVSDLSDFIKYLISTSTYDNVDDRFNSYVKFWELTGRDTSNSEEVYTSVFMPEKNIIDNVDSFFKNEESENKNNKKTTQNVGILDMFLNKVQVLLNKVGLDIKIKEIGFSEIWIGLFIVGLLYMLLVFVINLLLGFVEILSHIWFYILALVLIVFLINLWKKK